MTRLERLQQTGIIRSGSPKRGFRYRRADGGRLTKADRERIEALKIPPAWTDVAINASAGGRLQAVGKDAAGRWQYLYHEKHVRVQERQKYHRLVRFAANLPAARATVKRHLRQPGIGRERVLAAVLRILMTCFMRPGSQVYASENGSYGIATLKKRHVKVKGAKIDFDFPGKSGVRQQRELTDPQVARVVRAVLKVPGIEVFKFRNGDGEVVDLKRRHINAYIREIMGDSFSAKDFRTWAGTLICACALARVGDELLEKPAAKNRKVVEAIKETAQVLGNTPAVCRSSYISPVVIDSFLSGQTVENYFEAVEDFMAYNGRKLHPAEHSLMRLLKRKASRSNSTR